MGDLDVLDVLEPWEQESARRSMLRWEFATILHHRLWQKRHDGAALNNAELYALDLYAESVGMPISWLDKALQGNLNSGFQDFLSHGNSIDIDYAMSLAEDLYLEQSLAEPDKRKDKGKYKFRYLNREFLALIREELGKGEDEKVTLGEIMVNCFEYRAERLWKSHYITDENGSRVRVRGRRETRKLQERLAKEQQQENYCRDFSERGYLSGIGG